MVYVYKAVFVFFTLFAKAQLFVTAKVAQLKTWLASKEVTPDSVVTTVNETVDTVKDAVADVKTEVVSQVADAAKEVITAQVEKAVDSVVETVVK